jgi:hypothetical protein
VSKKQDEARRSGELNPTPMNTRERAHLLSELAIKMPGAGGIIAYGHGEGIFVDKNYGLGWRRVWRCFRINSADHVGA